MEFKAEDGPPVRHLEVLKGVDKVKFIEEGRTTTNARVDTA